MKRGRKTVHEARTFYVIGSINQAHVVAPSLDKAVEIFRAQFPQELVLDAHETQTWDENLIEK